MSRRAGFIEALTTDMEKLHLLCDPEMEDSLGLIGHPDGTWEVTGPPNELPSDLPDPVQGINFPRDTELFSWRKYVANHSDAWLYSVAFYSAGTMGFSKIKRRQLFEMINNIPTVVEVVVQNPTPKGGAEEEAVNDKPLRMRTRSANKNKDKTSGGSSEKEAKCCGGSYSEGGFWILCDDCEEWYHGLCVGIAPEEAKNMKLYTCPFCSRKKA